MLLQCEQADDGETAVEAVQKRLAASQHFDCILMDYVMIRMDGPTATSKIRELGVHWPIFGVTGNAFDADIQTFLAAGANKVLIKPLYIDTFNKAMTEVKVGTTSDNGRS